jgi:hypothetical protein
MAVCGNGAVVERAQVIAATVYVRDRRTSGDQRQFGLKNGEEVVS